MKQETLPGKCDRWRREGRLPADFFGPPNPPGNVMGHIHYQRQVMERLEKEDKEGTANGNVSPDS